MDIRLAQQGDLESILHVKQATWPEEAANPVYVAEVLREPGHVTVVAAVEGRVAGFADGFLTLSSDGVRRWEVDLLAVHPDYRNRGLASRLVAENTRAGLEMGAEMARALIRLDNTGSQRTFSHCGYLCDQNECTLYVSPDPPDSTVDLPPNVYLVPVSTINYRGLWVEGELSTDSLRYAQQIREEHGYDLVGAVIANSQHEAVQAAIRAGFTLVGGYQWWLLKADAGPARY